MFHKNHPNEKSPKPGLYSKHESNTLCSACEANTFSNSLFSAIYIYVDCPVGHIKNASGVCDKCVPGTYSDSTRHKCITCRNGFVDISGVTKCIAVSPGIQTSPSNLFGCMILRATVLFWLFIGRS